MTLQINDVAPDLAAETTEGRIRFYDWIGDAWAVLFSHPRDFTPVCTTELGYMARIKPEFDKRNAKIIGLGVDALRDHGRWANDIARTQVRHPTFRSSSPTRKPKNYICRAGRNNCHVCASCPSRCDE